VTGLIEKLMQFVSHRVGCDHNNDGLCDCGYYSLQVHLTALNLPSHAVHGQLADLQVVKSENYKSYVLTVSRSDARRGVPFFVNGEHAGRVYAADGMSGECFIRLNEKFVDLVKDLRLKQYKRK
jgi:hypothetical protein